MLQVMRTEDSLMIRQPPVAGSAAVSAYPVAAYNFSVQLLPPPSR